MTGICMTIIVFILSLTTLEVVESIKEYKEQEQKEIACVRRWEPPPIPKCDKPTWDRIREGCNEGVQ